MTDMTCTCTPEGCDEEGDPGCAYCRSLDSELPCPKEEPCDAFFAMCYCAKIVAHEGHHECECGGQWTGSDGTGNAKAKRLPQRGPLFESGVSNLLDAAFGDPQPPR